MLTQDQRGMFEAIAGILLRCFAFTVGVLFFLFGMILLMDDFIYRVHSSMFSLTRTHFDLMNYCGMALVKTIGFLFFLVPWASIKLYLKANKD